MSDGRLVFDTKIDTTGFKEGMGELKEAAKEANSFSVGKGIKSILGADLLKAAIKELYDFGVTSIGTAAQMESIQKRINDVFGGNADSVREYGAAAKENLGMAETAYLQYASVFATFFKNAGASEEEIFKWSTDLVARGGDLATYWGTSIEESLGKIYSGLKGETEAINDFGVDIRVAALSGFTGMDMTGADQLTQLTAVYSKIMQDTADQEGTFLKRQQTFAAQQQIFAANIQQVQQTIGGMLLPVATDVLTAINGIFDPQVELTVVDKLGEVQTAFENFETTTETAKTNFEEAFATAEARAKLAESYVQTLETLEGKEIKTDEDVEAINNAVIALNNLYPNLQLTMDPATGSINQNTEAIRNNIAAMQDLAMQKLFSEQWESNAAALATAYDNLASSTQTLEQAKEPLKEVEGQIEGVQAIFDQLLANGFSGINAYAGQFVDKIPSFEQYFKKNADGSYSVIDSGAIDPSVISADVQNTLAKLNAERNDIISGIEEAQAAVDGYNQAIADIQANQAEITEKQALIKELMQGAGQEAAEAEAQGITDNGSVVADAVQDVSDAAANNADTSTLYKAGVAGATAYANGLKSVSMPTLKPGTGAGVNGQHYSGLNYVPFDGYIARLHVGESVLSASEARKWRSGESGNANSNVMAAVGAAIAAERARPIDLYVNGKRFAEYTVNDNSRALAVDNMRSAKGVGRK